MDLKKQLKQQTGCEVSTDEKVLKEHSCDASLFQVMPSCVVFPRSVEDVKKIVRFVREHKNENPSLSITARSAGTDMSGGPLNESIILSFTKYMNSLEFADANAKVQPGLYFRDFEDKAEMRNLLFPSYPASKELCAWGGIINNNSGGELTLRYGKTNQYVEKMSVVLSDGNEYEFKKLTKQELNYKKTQHNFEGDIYGALHNIFEDNYELIQNSRPDVSKNSAGYNIWDVYDKETGSFDATQLFVGAQGTLGLMANASVRLIKKPTHRRLAVLFLKNWDNVPRIVNELQPLDPESMEVFDDETLKLAIRFFPDIARRAQGQNMFKLAKEFLPDFFIGVKMLGLPKLVILVEIVEHDKQEADRKLDELSQKIEKFKVQKHIVREEKKAEKYWIVRRESFQLLRTHIQNKRTAPFIDDIIVKPEFLPEFLPKVLGILKDHNIKATLAGHAGDGNFHIIPLMDLSKKSELEKIPVVSDKVYDLVIQYKGSITAEHNDGLIRSPYLQQMYGEQVFDIFKQIKNIFDPHNIFNPGKKIGSSMEYALEHIDHK